ncbi:hypothetical protein [Sulfitobacter aestuariivivens]|uniref:Uncharacterized protein n=1 Tax=Sulfitobacter aestuariivivens TaxID=2766981 RepID=A0A927DA18_9RHOB|nr:hypothetical protein [Sulfitobacter aestuariivivens]MBD3665937.1 hypothetical protein [Sulfitobacter aestuariivivens]
MTVQFVNDGAQFFAASHDILHGAGIRIEIGTDFDEYAKIVKKGRPIQALGAPFDPKLHDLNEKNAFWLAAYNSDDVLIHTQAAKLTPMGGKTLSEYMLKRFREFPPALPDIDFVRSRYRATPGAHTISGEVVYHGDIWINKEAGEYRGVGLSSVFARYGLMLIMEQWNPDYIFGFMARTVAFKGFAERMGYMHNEPGSLRWYRMGSDTAMEGFLSYLSNADVRFLFEMPLYEIIQQAA